MEQIERLLYEEACRFYPGQRGFLHIARDLNVSNTSAVSWRNRGRIPLKWQPFIHAIIDRKVIEAAEFRAELLKVVAKGPTPK